MSISPEVKRLNVAIDEALRTRPDRLLVADSPTDDVEADDVPDLDPLFSDEAEPSEIGAWLDKLAQDKALLALVPAEQARRRLLRATLGAREGVATRRGNKFLRDLYTKGQLILGWWGYEAEPIAVTTRQVVSGKVRVRQEHVAIRALTPGDLRDFATEERRRAANDFAARNETCGGAEWLAERIQLAGARTFHEWAVTVEEPPGEEPEDGTQH